MYNRQMDDVERTIARAAIDAPPAENTTQLAANIANAIHGDSMNGLIAADSISGCLAAVRSHEKAYCGPF
jgi:hypothetical protein